MTFSFDLPFSQSIVGSILCLLLVAAYVTILPPHSRGILRGRRYVMPPGPKGRPVVGSLPDWLQARREGNMVPWLVKQAQHGEMTTLSMGTKTWVLLNSSRVVNEIIAKRAGITHERPYFPIASGLVSQDKRVFLLKTDDWREGRRLLHRLMMGAGAKNHGDLAEVASLGLLKAYLDEPKEWYSHNYRYPIAIMSKIVTNTPVQKSTAELRDLQNVTSSFLTSINSSFVEFFPQLTMLPKPLQFWRRHWEDMGKFHYRVFNHWWAGMKGSEDGSAEPSYVRDVVLKSFSGTEEEAMYLSILAIVAGADNPRMTMNAWMMASIAYPGVMQKAREEVERVCGTGAGRLPTLDDLPSMPYMCAVVKEVLRWRPTVPLVPQRVLVEDLEFEGYTFPAGTEFLVNSIPVCSNGYDKPSEFCPERWLGSKEHGGGVDQDLWQFAFSGGRRSCVGYKLAQKELFVAFSRLLYCFDFSAGGPFDDRKLNAFEPGEPFPVKVVVRSPAHERLVREESAKCDLWGF
ncbi:Uu.00g145580.m01.CDS01 [Anthostomella pinea]|uniref:Uu.00g145580.m01.CDS01 n=1 Tax=Anthostomella pinea TaxID=933095 RepID=A0AAI8VR36_9PEZI|nr:Uu.00g145580.m01.CDS01 [Anthostomella pinea]